MDGTLFRDGLVPGFFGFWATGVFCRAGCRQTGGQGTPLQGEGFATVGAALQAGYRPCPVCQPLQSFEGVEGPMTRLLQALAAGTAEAVKPEFWSSLGLTPAFVQRWFNRHYGLGPRALGRALRRLPQAPAAGPDQIPKKLLKPVASVTDPATLLHVARLESPLGPLLAAATEDGICLLEFWDQLDLVKTIRRLRRRLQAQMSAEEGPLLTALRRQLDEYFAGRRRHFELPLIIQGTPFQNQVWHSLVSIPYGTCLSYSRQAEVVGDQRALRAVASANGKNPLVILVPCHRVIGQSGSLVGYSGGLWRKRFLLKLEQAGVV